MPTTNPRLTITLEPGAHALLKRLSALSGNSQASFVSELITSSLPVVERLIALMEAAKDVRSELSSGLVDELAAGQARMEAQLGLGLEDFDKATASLLDDAEKIKRRRGAGGVRKRASGAGAVPSSTPISNRGVRSTIKPTRPVP